MERTKQYLPILDRSPQGHADPSENTAFLETETDDLEMDCGQPNLLGGSMSSMWTIRLTHDLLHPSWYRKHCSFLLNRKIRLPAQHHAGFLKPKEASQEADRT